MAESAKPDVADLGKEADFVLLEGVNSKYPQDGSGLFDESQVNEWNTNKVFYWNDTTSYVKIKVSSNFRIWRSGTETWKNRNQPLNIKKIESDGAVVDYSSYHLPTSEITHHQWEVFTEKLPKGVYIFILDEWNSNYARLDSEWYIESTPSDKNLILSDGKYMKYENGWQTVTNSLPTLEELEEHGMEDMSALDRNSSDPYDSPLDELEEDFEVVVWTDDEDEKILHMSALPVPQFVHVIEGVGLGGDFSGITVTEEFDGTAENGTARYLISDDKTSWYTWNNGDFELISSLDNIETDGMALDTINNLSASDWEKWTHDTLFIGVYLNGDMQDQTKAYVENIDVELSVPTKTPEIDDVKMYILNTTATINVEFAGSTVSGYVEDADSTRVQYRVILNDEYYFPKSGEFTSLAPSPLSINLTLPNEDVKIDENNTLKIEFQDYWGSVDYWQTTFIGTYSGLLFTDEQGDYYSNEVGEVLKYLDFGVIIAGQTTIDHAIKLKNTYGYSVENIRITADESDFPGGMSAQFSKTQTPFQSEDVLVYNDVMDDGDEKTFYIRLATQLGVTSNAEGMFDISVKADQVTEDGS